MKYNGTIKGVVVLEGETTLREGTHVQVEPVELPPPPPRLGQRLKPFSGAAKRLPNDMARNHDHDCQGRRIDYIYVDTIRGFSL